MGAAACDERETLSSRADRSGAPLACLIGVWIAVHARHMTLWQDAATTRDTILTAAAQRL